MIAYLDSSALVPLLVREERSEASETIWNAATRALTVRIAYPEVCAALAMARRIGRIDEPTHRDLVVRFDELWQQIDVIEITKVLSERAAQLANDFDLRGYDAVHLAGAETVGQPDSVFACWDTDLVTAADALGLSRTQ